MNPQQYQQMMIQQLMGAAQLPSGMGGANPTTPYGANFITGNMSTPTGTIPGMGASLGAGPNAQGTPNSASMGQQPAPSQAGNPNVLMQPYAAYQQ